MEKVIFFALAVPILCFVFYLGGTAIMKGFKAKVENKPAKPEEKEEEGGLVLAEEQEHPVLARGQNIALADEEEGLALAEGEEQEEEGK